MTFRQKKARKFTRKSKTKRRARRLIGFIVAIALIIAAFHGARYFYHHKTMILYRLSGLSVVHEQKLSDEVEAYRPTIKKYAAQYNIAQFEDVIAAMMMQESKGLGNDPMQASESPHNRLYSKTPGGIQDPDYSIEVGVKYFAQCLAKANCTSPDQENALMLAIQGYNFGDGYITWAQKNDGGYSAANAKQFSAQMREKYGWHRYGDPKYAYKVMTYVNIQKSK